MRFMPLGVAFLIALVGALALGLRPGYPFATLLIGATIAAAMTGIAASVLQFLPQRGFVPAAILGGAALGLIVTPLLTWADALGVGDARRAVAIVWPVAVVAGLLLSRASGLDFPSPRRRRDRLERTVDCDDGACRGGTWAGGGAGFRTFDRRLLTLGSGAAHRHAVPAGTSLARPGSRMVREADVPSVPLKGGRQEEATMNTAKRSKSFCDSAALVCGTLALVVFLATPALANDPAEPTDRDISTAIDGALLYDSSVPAQLIDIKTQQGIVTLTGTVTSLRARDRAVRVAQTVKGVRSVVDRIEVDPPTRSDEEVRQDVIDALFLDPATDNYEITPTVTDGTVTLAGTVNSWQEQQLAVAVTKGVRGVAAVENKLAIHYEEERSDAEIEPEVRRSLENDPAVDAALIDVSVDGGTVTLSGTTGSAAESWRAESAAWVAGVKDVDISELSVEPWAARPQRRFQKAFKTNEEVEQAVRDAFLYDPRVYSFNPVITADDGVVTLTGIVDNLKAKQAAERDALNSVGVWRVRNYLKVRPASEVDDSTIAKNIDAALTFNSLTTAGDINVTSMDGRVTLTGTVDTYAEKSEAEDVAMRTNGVVTVINALTVRDPWLNSYAWDYGPFYQPLPNIDPMPLINNLEIQNSIEDELFWSPFVDSDEVSVSVTNGEATLTGTVDSWFEFRAAGENAFEGGARSVVNNLRVS